MSVGVAWPGTGEVAGGMPATGLMAGLPFLKVHTRQAMCQRVTGDVSTVRMWRTVPVGLL